MPFQLLEPTPARLATVTNRTEKHGDDDVPAVSLGIKIVTSNTILDLLSPGLMAQLYRPAEDAGEQQFLDDMAPTSLPRRRDTVIERMALKGELNGWTAIIDFGLDEQSEIRLAGSKVDKFAVTPHEGGSVDLTLRIGSSDLDEMKAGRLAMLNGHEVMLRLIAPERQPETAVIDGTQEAFERDTQGDLLGEPDATAAFLADVDGR